MLLVDTVSPVVLPIREWFWQIQCYQSESDIDRYSVSSQRVLLAETVLPGVLPAKEYY